MANITLVKFEIASFTLKEFKEFYQEAIPKDSKPTEDFWAPLFEWGFLKIVTVIWSSITILSFPLTINIGLLNSRKHYKTIIHDFESALCYYIIAGGLSSQLGHLLRMIFGPMPEFVCWWIIFCKNTIVHGIQLSMDFNIVFRYIYLIVLKSYATVNEEFWSFYLNLSIFLYAICVGYFYMEIPGRYAINYYICAGLNPDVDPYDYNKFPIGAIGASTYLIYLYLSYKVYRHKLKLSKVKSSIKNYALASAIQGTTRFITDHHQLQSKKYRRNQSRRDFFDKKKLIIGDKPKANASNGIFLLFVLTFVVLADQISWHSLVKKLSPDEIMNSTLSIIAIFWHEQHMFNALYWLFIISIYWRNPSLWKGFNI